ncbi:PAS domain S-box protein [Chloroflexota bacterium]
MDYKQQVKELEEQVTHLNALIETAPVIICRADLKGKITYVNKKFEEITGHSQDDLLGKYWFKLDIISPSNAKPLLRRSVEKIMGKPPSPMEVKIRHKDGTWSWVSGIGELIKEKDKAVGVQVIANDISDRKQTEDIIRQSEERLRIMVDSSPLPLIMTRYDTGEILMANSAFLELFKCTSQQLSDVKSTYFWEHIETERTKFMAELIEKGRVTQREFKARSLYGRTFDVLLSAQLIEYEGGSAALGVIYDLSERKRMEELLLHAASEWRITFDSIMHAISIHSEDFKVLRANKAFSNIVQMTPKEVIGKKCYQLIHGTDEPPPHCPLLNSLKKRQPDVVEFFEPHLNIHMQVTASPITKNNGDTASCVHILRDITSRVKAEEERRENTEKLLDVMEETIEAIATTAEIKDPYTAGHQRRVADLACDIARELGLSEDQAKSVRLAGTVHDIGKIYIPTDILNKPGKISDLEYGIIKIHAFSGYDVLRRIKFPWPIAKIVLQHHERIDGSGYPEGLKGNNILLEARILAVADVVEAMSSHRPYRPAIGLGQALSEISEKAGVQFDADVVKACLNLFREKDYRLA